MKSKYFLLMSSARNLDTWLEYQADLFDNGGITVWNRKLECNFLSKFFEFFLVPSSQVPILLFFIQF